jgi:hypothetical protein
MKESPTYLIAHLHQALLEDSRLCEQAVEITMADGRLVVRGEVATPERHDALRNLLAQRAPGIEVVDDVCVSSTSTGPREPETL